MRKLLDAGMRVFAERGYHAARVDDIVRAARTSHGTFYLYFANKEDLLRALAVEIDRLGVKAFTDIGTRLGQRMREVGADVAENETAAVGALMAMLERFNYALASRRLVLDEDAMLDTLAHIIHRGFFGAPASR